MAGSPLLAAGTVGSVGVGVDIALSLPDGLCRGQEDRTTWARVPLERRVLTPPRNVPVKSLCSAEQALGARALFAGAALEDRRQRHLVAVLLGLGAGVCLRGASIGLLCCSGHPVLQRFHWVGSL